MKEGHLPFLIVGDWRLAFHCPCLVVSIYSSNNVGRQNLWWRSLSIRCFEDLPDFAIHPKHFEFAVHHYCNLSEPIVSVVQGKFGCTFYANISKRIKRKSDIQKQR
jgi:hypothetical protein